MLSFVNYVNSFQVQDRKFQVFFSVYKTVPSSEDTEKRLLQEKRKKKQERDYYFPQSKCLLGVCSVYTHMLLY